MQNKGSIRHMLNCKGWRKKIKNEMLKSSNTSCKAMKLKYLKGAICNVCCCSAPVAYVYSGTVYTLNVYRIKYVLFILYSHCSRL